jgi:hypothetical protein
MECVMAKPTPCRITFTDADSLIEQQIRFHAVMVEQHAAKSTITKFPVMTGYEVSRNAIKRNREFTVTAVISNTVLEDSNNSDVMTGDISKTMHKALGDLVDNAQVCQVVSNLGNYDPVVFNSYTTKTDKDWSNAIMIILKGEQLQVKGNLNKTAPTALTFSVLTEEQAAVRRDELFAQGYDISKEASLEECTMPLGTDFVVENHTEQGVAKNTTFISTGQDPTTDAYGYEVHKDLDTVAGESGETEQGDLNESIWGSYFEDISISNVGGPLDSEGTSDFIVAPTDTDSVSPDSFDEGLPTADDVVGSASKSGNSSTTLTTVTKVVPATEATSSGNVL